jgi:hypothetical protein
MKVANSKEIMIHLLLSLYEGFDEDLLQDAV